MTGIDPNAPILDPMLFYWMNVLSMFKNALGWIIACLVIAIITLAIVKICITMGYYDGDPVKANKQVTFWLKFCCIAAPIVITIMCFVPNKETMIQIIAAHLVTPHNIETAIGTGKDLVTFLTDTIRDAVKDIIQTSNGVHPTIAPTSTPLG